MGTSENKLRIACTRCPGHGFEEENQRDKHNHN